MAVWTVIARPVTDNASRLQHAREVFIRYADTGIGLVILQQDVIPGLVFFNEIIL